ncbi:MAG: hypothetical protein QOJ32_2940, partial [Frankiaceae bacterium]|nr:hypothetical protein [Frankiaceae bacterium]
MYPGAHAAADPDKPAVVLDGTDRVLTYGDLEDRSVRLANALRGAGLAPGDTVGLLATN